MMAKQYIKLDFDWRHDPKVMLFESRYKKAALVDVVTSFALMSEMGGCIDVRDEGQMLRACQELGKTRRAAMELFGRMAECGIVRADWLEAGRVGSDRSMRDADKRARRREYALDASRAAAEKRAQRP